MAQPIKKAKVKNISIAVFENERNGEKTQSYVIQKGYKKKGDENWTNVDISLFDGEYKALKEAMTELDK